MAKWLLRGWPRGEDYDHPDANAAISLMGCSGSLFLAERRFFDMKRKRVLVGAVVAMALAFAVTPAQAGHHHHHHHYYHHGYYHHYGYYHHGYHHRYYQPGPVVIINP